MLFPGPHPFFHAWLLLCFLLCGEVDPESALSLSMLGPYSPLTFLSVLSLMIFYAATLNILLKLTKLQAALCCLQVCDFPHGELPVFMRMADLSDPCLSFNCFSWFYSSRSHPPSEAHEDSSSYV